MASGLGHQAIAQTAKESFRYEHIAQQEHQADGFVFASLRKIRGLCLALGAMKFAPEEIDFVRSTVRLNRLRIPLSLTAIVLGLLSCALYVWQSDVLSQPIDTVAAQVGEEAAKPIRIAFELGWKKGMAAATALVVGGLLLGSGMATLLGFTNRKLNSLLERIATEA
ncbi:hypothetical protein [Sinimarinibacterium flocculans]|uniref:hypothetical protein n=1 Tax=Sinimarinibacterium flocculans TaxID=985250 RepID=UPI00351947AA